MTHYNFTLASVDTGQPVPRAFAGTLDDIDRALHDLASQSDHLRLLIDRARLEADALREGRGS